MKVKRLLAGVMALSLAAGFTACGSTEEASDNTTEAATTTGTTAATVEINTEGLKEEEQSELEIAMAKLPDRELEDTEIKWRSHYDLNPSTTGESKKVELEMFEQKYGGTVTYYPTTYENRYNDLSTYILGGEGIDFFGEDTYNFPKGIVSGMFQPIDDYIDLDSELWQQFSNAMDVFEFNGKHYQFVTNVYAEQVCLYNKATIEENGFDDPWELYENGEWNWDTFREMLLQFVDEDSGKYGLDGWYNEKALLLSAGVPFVGTDDSGSLVCNINDATIEKAMNYQYDLYCNGLAFPIDQFNWQIQTQKMGEGNELFLLYGTWGVQGDPSTWASAIEPENLGIVPVPSPADSDPYQSAAISGYVLCKGASNPEGVAALAECAVVANTDEGLIAISGRKSKDDNEWTDEFIERKKEIDALAREYPVYDLASGCSTEIASIATDGSEMGMRAAFHGVSWATNRDSIADTLIMLVDEVDQKLKSIE